MIQTGGTNLFIASMWRSGSIHIANTMARLLNFRSASTTGFHGEGSEQQNINYVSGGILFPYGRQVFLQHVWASTLNTSMLSSYNIRPVVVMRNISDIIVSLKEHIDNLEIPVIPGIEIPGRWTVLDDHAKFDWLATHVFPWLMQFYWTWQRTGIDKMFIRYEDFYADQVAGCKKIAEWLELPLPDDAIIKSACGVDDNFVTGKSGRGNQLIPQELLDRMKELTEKEIKAWVS